MSYKYKFTAEEIAFLEPLGEQLSCLSEGETLIIEERPEAIGGLRTLIYSYLHYLGIKNNYRISQVSIRKLLILRSPKLRPVFSTARETASEKFFKSELISCSNREAALTKISQAREKEKLSQAEALDALSIWERVCEN